MNMTPSPTSSAFDWSFLACRNFHAVTRRTYTFVVPLPFVLSLVPSFPLGRAVLVLRCLVPCALDAG